MRLGRGDLDDVTAAVLGVTAAPSEVLGLELVEQKDEVVGVHVEDVAELLLGKPVALCQVGQNHEVAQPHAQQLLRSAPVHDLREPCQKHDRARLGRWPHGP